MVNHRPHRGQALHRVNDGLVGRRRAGPATVAVLWLTSRDSLTASATADRFHNKGAALAA